MSIFGICQSQAVPGFLSSSEVVCDSGQTLLGIDLTWHTTGVVRNSERRQAFVSCVATKKTRRRTSTAQTFVKSTSRINRSEWEQHFGENLISYIISATSLTTEQHIFPLRIDNRDKKERSTWAEYLWGWKAYSGVPFYQLTMMAKQSKHRLRDCRTGPT